MDFFLKRIRTAPAIEHNIDSTIESECRSTSNDPPASGSADAIYCMNAITTIVLRCSGRKTPKVGFGSGSTRPHFGCTMILVSCQLHLIHCFWSPTILNGIDGDDKRALPFNALLPRPQSTPSTILVILPLDIRAYGERSDLSTCRFLPSPFLNGGLSFSSSLSFFL
ncbi:hypothetical protein T265_08958 [Opisthorchis viverrini]|uniref:Uncharacterized protein n=1 Tax=Opisthorchis viverrini TaxID=6198 RepID=A0A074ZBY3_OPIVI|nr:hypothetical protein T265_08958 [Opisthorchis viverrini]KER23107.1 hypothetical protein T265_08958 [Opisthorchis viverrini]